jgi:hypothetical protein
MVRFWGGPFDGQETEFDGAAIFCLTINSSQVSTSVTPTTTTAWYGDKPPSPRRASASGPPPPSPAA